jgi:hypothetical protein
MTDDNIIQFPRVVGRTAKETAEMVEFMREYEEHIEALKEHFGHWDHCDPVVSALICLVEAQNELAAAIDGDALYGNDARLAPAREAREQAIADLQMAIEEARRERICPYC